MYSFQVHIDYIEYNDKYIHKIKTEEFYELAEKALSSFVTYLLE